MDRTNMFFWIVAGGAAWFMWREYQKQQEAQQRQSLQRQIQTTGTRLPPIDYAEQIATGYI